MSKECIHSFGTLCVILKTVHDKSVKYDWKKKAKIRRVKSGRAGSCFSNYSANTLPNTARINFIYSKATTTDLSADTG